MSEYEYRRLCIFDYLSSRLWKSVNKKFNDKKNIDINSYTAENFIQVSKCQEEDIIEVILSLEGLSEKRNTLVEKLNEYEKVKLNRPRQVLYNKGFILLQKPFKRLTLEE